MCIRDRKEVVKKTILSSGGSLKKIIGPDVDYVVCQGAYNKWDRNLELAQKENPEIKCVHSEFITDYYKKGQLLETPNYYITKNVSSY